MKKTPKTVYLLLALTLILSLFSGCAGETADPTEAAVSQTPATAAPTTQTPEQSQEPDGPVYPLKDQVTLTALGNIYSPRTAGLIETWSDQYVWMKSFEATNVYIEMDCIATSAYAEQFGIIIASEDYPNLLTSASQYYAGGRDQMIEDGVAIDITPYLTDETSRDYLAMIEGAGLTKDMTTDTGNITCFYNFTDSVYSNGPMIRKDWLDQLNMDVPVTYDDYTAMLEAFKVEIGASEPFLLNSTGIVDGDYMVSGFDVALYGHFILGGDFGFYHVGDEVKYGYLEEGFEQYITLMNDWFSKGYISTDFVSANENKTSDIVLQKIYTGETGFFHFDRDRIHFFAELATDPNFNAIAVPDVVQYEGQQTHMTHYRQSSLHEGLTVTSSCKNVEAACLWNNYWYTEEGQILANYGEEGMTFEYDGNGKPYYTEFVYNNPDGLAINQVTYLYLVEIGHVTEERQNSLVFSDEAVAASTVWGTNKDNSYKMPMWASMTADESAAYNQKFSDIKTYLSEAIVKFIVGETPLSQLDDFRAKLYEMGIEECIAYQQAALDRYNQR